jgi:hypothetical protein
MWGGAYCLNDIVLFLNIYSLYFNWFFLFADTSCKMVRQNGKRGLEEDWRKSDILPFESDIENCEDVCIKNQSCVALHHTHYVCYTYYELGIIEDDADSVFSEKNCSNTPRK